MKKKNWTWKCRRFQQQTDKKKKSQKCNKIKQTNKREFPIEFSLTINWNCPKISHSIKLYIHTLLEGAKLMIICWSATTNKLLLNFCKWKFCRFLTIEIQFKLFIWIKFLILRNFFFKLKKKSNNFSHTLAHTRLNDPMARGDPKIWITIENFILCVCVGVWVKKNWLTTPNNRLFCYEICKMA